MESVILTERLKLRKWKESDAEKLYTLAKAAEVGEGAGWLPHTDVDYSRAIIRTILSAEGEYCITNAQDNESPVGSIGFRIAASQRRGIDREDEAEVGYWIGRDYWNRGFATEALSEIIRHCFVDIGLNRVWGSYFDGNDRSRRVMEKCGLVFHHRNENMYNAMLKKYYNETMMCITAEEYFRTNKEQL